MSGHNPFLVESDDDDDDDREEENLLRTAAARANVMGFGGSNISSSSPEMMYGGGEGEASHPMKTTSSSTSSSSVFANKSSRESVPPLPSAPRMTTRSSGSNSTTTTHTTTTGGGGGFWIFSFKYYQKYFDVDTADVLRRIKKGTYGALGGALFLDDVKEKPDLYGAFWGCATLVFVVAMGGNFAEYLESMSSSSIPTTWYSTRLTNGTIAVWDPGITSSWTVPSKMSLAVKRHLAWPCLPVLEVETETTLQGRFLMTM